MFQVTFRPSVRMVCSVRQVSALQQSVAVLTTRCGSLTAELESTRGASTEVDGKVASLTARLQQATSQLEEHSRAYVGAPWRAGPTHVVFRSHLVRRKHRPHVGLSSMSPTHRHRFPIPSRTCPVELLLFPSPLLRMCFGVACQAGGCRVECGACFHPGFSAD